MGVRCLSGNSLKAVFNGTDFADSTKAIASIKTIRDAIKGKFKLPNLNDEHDPLIGVENTITTHADGTQDAPATDEDPTEV